MSELKGERRIGPPIENIGGLERMIPGPIRMSRMALPQEANERLMDTRKSIIPTKVRTTLALRKKND